MKPLKSLLPVFACLALTGCAADSTPTEPPPEQTSSSVVDYSAIEGNWAGWDDRGTYVLKAHVNAEARAGVAVGSFDVFLPAAGGHTPYCDMVLKAESADPPTYFFAGGDGTCTPTRLTFRHDPDENRITVTNSNGETGYLVPGTDPGTFPR